MGASYTAKATVNGINIGGITCAGITGAASLLPTSGNLSSQRPTGELTNPIGEPSCEWVTHGKYILDVTWTIQASAIATAKAALVEPTPLASVTLGTHPTWGTDLPAAWQHSRWYVVPNTWTLDMESSRTITYKFQIACSTDSSVNLSTPIT